MRILCRGCGTWHDISPTGLAVVIEGFQDGDLTTVHTDAETPVKIESSCIKIAFTDPARMKEFHRRYKGNMIVVDGEHR